MDRPPAIRQLRALLRYQVALVRLRNRIHAIVPEYGHDRPLSAYGSGAGRAWLASLELPAVSRDLAADDLGLIGALQGPLMAWSHLPYMAACAA